MISPSELILRLALAALLGSVIGYERRRRDWTAGLRDHMLVCVGAALFMLVSTYGFADVTSHPGVVLDPSRVAAQVVTGIGFVGAGTILVKGEVIKGLTTAASLWVIAAVGLAAGGGLYLAATLTTVLLLGILAGLKRFEKRLLPERRLVEMIVRARAGAVDLATLTAAITACGCAPAELVASRDPANGDSLNRLSVRETRSGDAMLAIAALREVPGVAAVECHRL